MGNVIEFKMGRTRTREAAALSERNAQILFFTGIRYIRDAEEDERGSLPEARQNLAPDRTGHDASGLSVERAAN